MTEPTQKIQMKKITQKIWEAFCGELTQEPTDSMREALSTAIREVANEVQYYNLVVEGLDLIIDPRDLYDIADELEVLE
jgi:hypothetical protein